MTPRLYLAILWAAARIVRESDRAEWQAEWQTELWYAMRADGPRRVAWFCLGSIPDALWKRRNAGIGLQERVLPLAHGPSFPEPPELERAPLLESPFGILALLAVLALIAVSAGMFVPESPSLSTGELFLTLLPICAILWPIAALTSGAALGDYPQHRNWLRRWCFHIAKVMLLLLIVVFGASDLTASPARLNIAEMGAFLAIRWAMLDQGRRCPTCLRLLGKPVRMGSGSRILLEWNGDELLCLRGHGVMHIPESPAIWFRKPRWMSLG